MYVLSRRLLPTGVALLAALGASLAHAQQPQGPQLPFARLFTVMPSGGKLGTTFEVAIGGADLEEAIALHFSAPGVTAKPIPDFWRPGKFLPSKFLVTIAPNTSLGIHDVRASGRFGMSNPRAFVVGELDEVVETEGNNDVPQAQKIELGTTVSGIINPNTDVDYFSFAGKQGQRVVVHCGAHTIDSRLDPQLQLYDAGGRLLASNRRYHDRDAIIDAVLPADADYFIRLCQHAHITGSPEFFYRLSVSLAPWIDAAYPPVLERGKATPVTLFGRNLPFGQPDPKATLDGRPLDKLSVPITPPADPASALRLAYTGHVPPWAAALDGFEHRVKNAAGSSNPVLLAFATGPVFLDNEENDAPEKAQAVSIPCELCGRIEKKRDRDWYTFTGKANDAYMIEAFADRLGSPLDLYFELRRIDDKDPKNRPMIGEFDDSTDILHPLKFNTRTDDPKTRFVVPADGKYELFVASRTGDVSAGPRHIYRLSIRKETPDFRLILVDHDDNDPCGLTVRQGGGQFIHALCQRIDGFTGDVTVSVEGLPAGVTCPPQVLGSNQKQTPLVLTAKPDAPPWAGEIRITGTATINGKPEVREARGGCVVWPVQPQQNIPTISRLSRSICLAVREKGPFAIEASVKEVALPVGAALPVKVKVDRQWPEAKVPLQLLAIDLPPNLVFGANNQPVNVPPDKNEADVQFQIRNNVPPGVYNVVLRGTGQVPFNKDSKATQKQPLGSMTVATPIRLTVYNTVAEVSLGAPSLTVKGGADVELVVRVNRLNGYQGEFKVQLVLPQGFQGVTAAEATIPANANETKLVLKGAANAAPAMNANVIVKATATVEKITLTHEAKLAVTIEK